MVIVEEKSRLENLHRWSGMEDESSSEVFSKKLIMKLARSFGKMVIIFQAEIYVCNFFSSRGLARTKMVGSQTRKQFY